MQRGVTLLNPQEGTQHYRLCDELLPLLEFLKEGHRWSKIPKRNLRSCGEVYRSRPGTHLIYDPGRKTPVS